MKFYSPVFCFFFLLLFLGLILANLQAQKSPLDMHQGGFFYSLYGSA